MGEETFADYFFGEKDWGKKLEIMYYLKKRTGIYYDNTVIFKTLLTKLFLSYLNLYCPDVNVDENIVISARLLCDCKKIENSTDLEKIRSYAKEEQSIYLRLDLTIISAEFVKELIDIQLKITDQLKVTY